MRFIFFSLIALTSVLASGCSKQPTQQSKPQTRSLGAYQPLKVSPDQVKVYLDLLQDGFIYADIKSDTQSDIIFYKYSFKTEQAVEIGKVPNFMMSIDAIARIGDYLYYDLATSPGGHDARSSSENCLIAINLAENSLKVVAKNSSDQPGGLLMRLGQNLLMHHTVWDKEKETTTTFLTVADRSDYQVKYQSKQFQMSVGAGETVMSCSVYDQKVYALLVTQAENKPRSAVLDVYDNQLKLTQTLPLGDISDILMEGWIQKFFVWNQFVYIKTANHTVLGTLDKSGLTRFENADNLELVGNTSNTKAPVFFVRYSNQLVTYDPKTKQLLTYQIQLKKGYTIQHVIGNNEDLLLTLAYMPETAEASDKTLLYHVSRDLLT